MDNNGWLKIHRSILKWEFYHDTKVVRFYFHCLLSANYEDRKWSGVVIPRGSFETSYESLARALSKNPKAKLEDLDFTIQNVRTCIKKLTKSGNITTKSTNQYTIISVCKYDFWQQCASGSRYESDTQSTIEQQASNMPISKEEKEIAEEKEYLGSLKIDIKRYGDDWCKVIGQWMYFKYANGKPYVTQSSVNSMMKRLIEISGGDIETARKIIEQSMANNWSGLFALKDNNKATNESNYQGDSTLGEEFERKV